ncbi:MAG TPA: acyl-ACP thioesterase domain-containing protein [Spirochaetia bacterium]|nr:acyl-ACP thioesterase domain-containing protein [Spirochaetia bacterium]
MSSPPREYHEEFSVRSYEVEPDGRLRVVVLLRMLQEAAWQHANLLGKGFNQREAGELFWVLSRLRLTVDRYPRWGERFTVRTFPVGTEKILAVREFTLLDSDDVPIGRASSGWLVVDGSKGRPLRPEQIVADIVTTQSEYEGDLSRVEPLAPEAEARGPFPVRYHDIDQYRHVNNAAYVEWVLDAIAAERPVDRPLCGLAIDFLKETLLEDEYFIALESDLFEVRRAHDDTPTARGRLSWSAVDHP